MLDSVSLPIIGELMRVLPLMLSLLLLFTAGFILLACIRDAWNLIMNNDEFEANDSAEKHISTSKYGIIFLVSAILTMILTHCNAQ